MRKLLTLSSIAVAATALLTVPAFAQGAPPAGDEAAGFIPSAGQYRQADQDAAAPARALGNDAPASELDDEIWVACLRLPALADLSKERWNEVHRRFDGRRGRPLRNA